MNSMMTKLSLGITSMIRMDHDSVLAAKPSSMGIATGARMAGSDLVRRALTRNGVNGLMHKR